jgi:hypothetical protein
VASSTKPATSAPTTTQATPAAGIAHVPINAINKAKAVADAQGAGAAETDSVVASDSAPSQTTTAHATKAPTPARAPNVAVTELAPGVSATTATDAEPTASSVFRTYVANLHVTGAAGGSAQRALINGRLIRKGEMVDSNLGVTFEGVQGSELVFKDRSGAIVKRRY